MAVVKGKIKEELSEECFLDYKFQEREIYPTVEKERKQHIQIEKQIKDEYSYRSENWDCNIKTEMNNVDAYEGTKSEEIDIKHEPLENISAPCSGQGEEWTLSGDKADEIISKQPDLMRPESLQFICEEKELTHSNTSKRNKEETYTCDLCNYKTKTKRYFKMHMLVHKDPSEIKLHKCTTCTFSTKRKDILNRHNLTHLGISKKTHTPEKYTCDLCNYETTVRRYLKMHMLMHKGPSENQRYKCDLCDYQSHWMSRIKRHGLVHKKATATNTFVPVSL